MHDHPEYVVHQISGCHILVTSCMNDVGNMLEVCMYECVMRTEDQAGGVTSVR